MIFILLIIILLTILCSYVFWLIFLIQCLLAFGLWFVFLNHIYFCLLLLVIFTFQGNVSYFKIIWCFWASLVSSQPGKFLIEDMPLSPTCGFPWWSGRLKVLGLWPCYLLPIDIIDVFLSINNFDYYHWTAATTTTTTNTTTMLIIMLIMITIITFIHYS